MGKHTPGPWVYDKVETSCGHCFRIGSQDQIDAPKDQRKLPSYACLYVDYGNASQEAEANAHLIAAGPELLHAAIRVRARMQNYRLDQDASDVLDAIDAAIAKATGAV